jgi:RNA polymerase sigma factor (sigma-70 family)
MTYLKPYPTSTSVPRNPQEQLRTFTQMVFSPETTLLGRSDLELVDKIREGDNEAFKEVCRRYENVFFKMCQRYFHALTSAGVDPQDIFNEKNCIIFNCVRSFDPQRKTKLSTHIGNYARYLCLNSINERRFFSPTTDDNVMQELEDEQANIAFLHSNRPSKETFNYLLNLLSQLKDPRISEIFRYRYLEPKRLIWNEISKKMKISTQTAINLHNKGLKLLRLKLKSENISDVV